MMGAGAAIVIGAPSVAGATRVPQGEPLWNQLRTLPRHPQHPLLDVTSADANNRTNNFLMIRFSAEDAAIHGA